MRGGTAVVKNIVTPAMSAVDSAAFDNATIAIRPGRNSAGRRGGTRRTTPSFRIGSPYVPALSMKSRCEERRWHGRPVVTMVKAAPGWSSSSGTLALSVVRPGCRANLDRGTARIRSST
jgi:hypothetical protein